MSNVCPVCNNEIKENESVCPTCGFKLLGSTVEFQPISLDTQGETERLKEAKSASIACLKVIRGPQIGTSYRLDDKKLSIGRSPQCDIFLNDMTVSRTHANIVPEGSHFVIQDCQSYNGIWINNKSVERAILHENDIIQIGAFCLKFEE